MRTAGFETAGTFAAGGGVPKSGSSPPVAEAERRDPNANAEPADKPARARRMNGRGRVTEVEVAPTRPKPAVRYERVQTLTASDAGRWPSAERTQSSRDTAQRRLRASRHLPSTLPRLRLFRPGRRRSVLRSSAKKRDRVCRGQDDRRPRASALRRRRLK